MLMLMALHVKGTEAGERYPSGHPRHSSPTKQKTAAMPSCTDTKVRKCRGTGVSVCSRCSMAHMFEHVIASCSSIEKGWINAVQLIPAACDAGFASCSCLLFALPRHQWPAPSLQTFVSFVPCKVSQRVKH